MSCRALLHQVLATVVPSRIFPVTLRPPSRAHNVRDAMQSKPMSWAWNLKGLISTEVTIASQYYTPTSQTIRFYFTVLLC